MTWYHDANMAVATLVAAKALTKMEAFLEERYRIMDAVRGALYHKLATVIVTDANDPKAQSIIKQMDDGTTQMIYVRPCEDDPATQWNEAVSMVHRYTAANATGNAHYIGTRDYITVHEQKKDAKKHLYPWPLNRIL